jgi:two-component system sensor histidine kinase PilS (NtrC family)
MTLDSTLEQRLKRLMLFRVVMITTLLLIAIYVEAESETLLPVNPLYFLIIATYLLTLVYVFALRAFRGHQELQVYLQVTLDLIVITGLVYLTGGTGTRAGFMLLYPISVLSGSVLLYKWKGLILAGLAAGFYGGVLWAVRAGLVAPRGLPEVPFLPLQHLVYAVFVTGVACATVALIGSYLAESLRSVGEQLEEAAEEVADLRGLNEVIVDSIQSGLLTVDPEGHVLWVNRHGESILGRSAAEIRGRPLAELLGSRLFDTSALRARSAHERLARAEVAYTRPDGDTLELGISVSPLADAGPGRGGNLLVFQNLTEIKRLEEEVRVKEKLAAVGEMAAQLAHEIRNPLGAISGSAQMLMGEPNISEDQERLLGIVTRESRRLSDTLNRFLFQARPAPSPLSPVDIGPVVAEAVTLLRNSPEVGSSHTILFEIDGAPHVCLADPHQVAQVFWNLVRNGLEAMPDGGSLTIRVARQRDEMVLVVQDQGRGIPREEQRRIFDPFHSRLPMGTGLGLAIVYRIVREHRGDITVRSVPNLGTVVEVRLPLVSVPASA